MKEKKLLPDQKPTRLAALYSRLLENQMGPGFAGFMLLLLGLSALGTYDFSPSGRLFTLDEVATYDVTADRSFLLEDADATRARRETAAKNQPLVCDLNLEPLYNLRKRVQDTFISINNADNPAELAALHQVLSDESPEDFPYRSFELLIKPEVQQLVTTKVLPWLEQRLREGAVSDMRLLMNRRGGVLIRNLQNGEEKLLSDTQSVPSIKDVSSDLALMLRGLDEPGAVKRAVAVFLNGLVMPTLTPNYESTSARAEEAVRAVQPVIRSIQRGEIIVRQGERVTREQQVALQALWKRKADPFNPKAAMGTFFCAAILSMGLFVSPSGKPGSPVQQKDMIFVGVLVSAFALISKGLQILGQTMAASSPNFPPDSLAFAVPVAGAAGIAALILSTRRYLVTGLLLAFFCTLMQKGGVGLFLFYFISAMWNTWLVVRTQSRQDVVWNFFPLLAGLFFMWAAVTFSQGGLHVRYLPESLAVLANGMLSMLTTFALAPIVEMVFGYSTRFRLMELMNLEQPLLRELMLNAPGTYHHSLIVSNMVEAAAKAIGAHSLLCKVGALYHDIGKTDKAGYFIENQFVGENPHDRLTPAMSALVLISHVKRGAELAQQNRLGREVTDIIRQHHGTGVIRYFYQKALAVNENTSIADFCYPGPRPQSREAVLVMLADVVEASSRSLSDPTPSRVRAHIKNVIRASLADGQMDEAELTFKDLDLVEESFQRILVGIFHHRIEYPDKAQAKSISAEAKNPAHETPAEAPAESAQPAEGGEAASPAQNWLPAAKEPPTRPEGKKPPQDAADKPAKAGG